MEGKTVARVGQSENACVHQVWASVVYGNATFLEKCITFRSHLVQSVLVGKGRNIWYIRAVGACSGVTT